MQVDFPKSIFSNARSHAEVSLFNRQFSIKNYPTFGNFFSDSAIISSG